MTLRGTSQLNAGPSGVEMRDGRPHHVIISSTNTLVQIYQDGLPTFNTAGTWTPTLSGLPFYIGGRSSADLGPFLLDDVQIIRGTLSAAEALSLYQTGTLSLPKSRAGWWGFDEGSGTVATDLSGTGNTGTITAAPPFVAYNPYPGTERQFRVCDLLTITPLGATAVYYTNLDQDIVYGGHTFLSGNTKFRRSKTKLVAGIDVDSMDLELYGDSTNLIAGLGVLSACRAGLLDGARVSLDKLYMPDWGLVGLGVVNMFAGRVGTIQLSRSVAKIKTVSDLVLLNVDMPRNIYQPGCRHSLFDGGCTLNPASFIVSGAVTAGSTANSVNTNLSQVSAYFTLGTMTFTSGVNNGLTRTIRQHTNAGGVMVPILPWPAAPATSDTFTALPGDDKQQSTCLNKFNNLVHFRAEPYVPVPETQI